MHFLRRCVAQSSGLSQSLRNYSYKTVKRPTFNTKSKLAVQQNIDHNISLSKVLSTLIAGTGPISVAEYMKQVLTNPHSGYYMLKDVFGEKGDFITSPEINQIFGEVVAVWCINEWQKCGSPGPLQIVELGPGRGTLAQDLIRVLAAFGLSNKFSLHLVEVSPYLSEIQAKRLCSKYVETKAEDADTIPYYRKGETLSGVQVYWYRTVEQIPKSFSIFLAHEFFDVLPIHKFQRKENTWHEILIDIDREKANSFRFVESKAVTPMLGMFLTRPWIGNIKLADHIEYSKDAEQTLETIAIHIEENGGFGLIMDYGTFGEQRDTFRAFKKHGLHDPLVEPGTADLTADVDYSQFKAIAEQNDRLITFGPVEQGDFLNRLGGEVRLEKLVEKCQSEADAESLKSGYKMLTDPSQMGSRFKFFAMFPKVLENHLSKFPVNGFSDCQEKR